MKHINTILLIIISFALGFGSAEYIQDVDKERMREAARIATYISSTWQRDDEGQVKVLIPHYPKHEWYILFGAYTDPKKEISKEIDPSIANKISSHGDDRDWMLYVVFTDNSIHSADINMKSYGKTHILDPYQVVIVKNSKKSISPHKMLRLINGQKRT